MIQKIIIYTSIILQISAFIPEIFLLQRQIQALELQNRELSKKRKEYYPSFNTTSYQSAAHLPEFDSFNMHFNAKCKIEGENLQFFIFQTVQSIYIAVNYPELTLLSIYNTQCQLISEIMNVQAYKIICDRGICQSGLVHLIGKDEMLYKLYEESKFRQITLFKDLKRQSKIIDGLVRYRRKDKFEIYIYYEDGEVKVIDQGGNQTISFDLQGQNQIIHVADHHPYPFVITSMNWVSVIDTLKYNEINHNCPYIPHIQYILSETYYGDIIYIITNKKIIHLEIDINKKTCLIKQTHPMQIQLSGIQTATFFNNLLFIDNKVYNFSDKKLYIRQRCQMTKLEFINKKSNQEEMYSLEHCCNGTKCSGNVYEVKKINDDKSILIWLTLVFIFIIFISVSFMKKSNISNLDFDDPVKMKQIEIQQQIYQMSKKTLKAQKPKPF